MSIQLAEGVQLHVLPTKKYKTVQMVVKLRTPLDKKSITKRALLSSLLETNSEKYPTQTALRSELSNLYGASFGTSISKKGTSHILSIGLNVVNEKYLTMGDSVLKEAIAFLKEIIFKPNATDGHFDEETFRREKENLNDYYDSIADDKQTYASLELQHLFFDDEGQQTPSIGTKEDLIEITAVDLYHYYQKALKEDQVDIYVLGDVEKEQIEEQFKLFPFEARNIAKQEAFYATETFEKVVSKIEEQDITQAKFNLGYATNIFYHQKNYYAGQVFNGLFGGFPHSKLFMNVREKESLAYYASSSLDTFRGMMSVQTGIESKKVDQVKEIITMQLKEMQAGNFTDEALNQTKEMLKNQLLQSEDHSGAIIERMYANQMAIGKVINLEEWIADIEAVTTEQVIEVANQVKLKATFFLSGEVN
ncbi:EF-P 5-aminopentanol modification-associated protein YfmF [Carnobacterium antarcticum]|uniref:EF-P 5-aminopentanol modification-associated protein YfmF n=1 Tax=Carnobacterium antarcticum TaxID=2126436 RepID=A0ABW4NQ01_9LACT|nr:pitrilysin family protein [Carnobacterium sp. CP1]ALV22965.1 Zinc protease [Carnobacterium sp. CP1]